MVTYCKREKAERENNKSEVQLARNTNFREILISAKMKFSRNTNFLEVGTDLTNTNLREDRLNVDGET